jgi:hypothetical protein
MHTLEESVAGGEVNVRSDDPGQAVRSSDRLPTFRRTA